MKLISVTRSERTQSLGVISDSFKLHKMDDTSVTVVTTNVLMTKDMFLTFSKQEVLTLLSYFEERENESANFVSTLKGMNKPSNPNDSGDNSGSLV